MTRLEENDARHATAHGGNERRGLYRLPSKEVRRGCTLSRLGIAAERLRSPSVSAPHRESPARPTGPGLLTYLIVPKVPKVPTDDRLSTSYYVLQAAAQTRD